MDWIGILATSIVMAIMTISMKYMDASAIDAAKEGQKTAKVELRMNKVYKILAILIAVLAVAAIFVTIFLKATDHLLEIAIIATMVYGVGLLCMKFYTNHKVILDDQKIEVSNWLGKTKGIEWTQIEQIKFNSLSGYIIVKNSATVLKIHYHIAALTLLGQYIEKNTNWKVKELKLPIYMPR